MAIDQFPANERPFRDSKFRNRLNELVAAVNEMLGKTDDKPIIYEFEEEGQPQQFIRLTGKTLSSGTVNAWDYNWTLLAYDLATDEFIPATPSVTDATTGYTKARNSLERRNPTTALSGGTGDMPIGSGLPITAGTLKAIGTTSGQEADVPCWFVTANIGTVEEPVLVQRPIFCVPNSFDCEGA